MFESSKRFLSALVSIAKSGLPENYTSSEQVLAALMTADIKRPDAQRIADLSKPCLWLKTTLAKQDSLIPVGATKIGGNPDLPEHMNWPERPAYTNGADRALENQQQAENADQNSSWATPEQIEEFKQDYLQMADILDKPFPLPFIAQINFAELWAAGPVDEDFPPSGLLSVFYDTLEQPWGFNPSDHAGARIIYHEQKIRNLKRCETPRQLSSINRYNALSALECELHPAIAPLPRESVEYGQLNLSEKTDDLYHEWRFDDDNCVLASEEGNNSACHRIGGWPTPVQGDMQIECALVSAGHSTGDAKAYRDPAMQSIRNTAPEWLLLAQIGTDEKANMMWGDSGQLYVWIRREDLRARNFNKARIILQCY